MELESQSVINPRHKSCPIKLDQPSIAWIKFITLSYSFGPSLECPTLESAQISWISPLSASLIFLDLALVIGSTEHAMDPWMLVDSHKIQIWFFNTCWFFEIKKKIKSCCVCFCLFNSWLHKFGLWVKLSS